MQMQERLADVSTRSARVKERSWFSNHSRGGRSPGENKQSSCSNLLSGKCHNLVYIDLQYETFSLSIIFILLINPAAAQ